MVLVSLMLDESRVVVLEDTISKSSLSFIGIGSTLLGDKVDKSLHGLRVSFLLKYLKVSHSTAREADVAHLVIDEE
jgi:hypothetical protein